MRHPARLRLVGRRGAAWRLILAVGAVGVVAACGRNAGDTLEAQSRAAEQVEARYVGGAVCAGCHEAEASRWAGSHHDLALQEADASTVLGDFADAEFSYGGITTRFSRREGRYYVRTDGPDGELGEFEVRFTFGIEPLQQYLLELDDGKIQALSIAWDARPAGVGGQRWFHLYPDEVMASTDPLHWTGAYQRWNTMCADCHSTNLIKAYDRALDRFETEFSALDVDCEACHGPGSAHAAEPAVPLPARIGTNRSWVFETGAAIASRIPAPDFETRREIDVCARCHSRRAQLTDAFTAGDDLLDGYRPEFLSEDLYHADGQILDEVYVYGSFVQSAMAAAGVVCSDCHDPHTAELRADGNGVCAQCHLASVFDEPTHHHHEPGGAGTECTACHMRSETYMVVDPRRDHSFRVPRPDLSAALASPNACNDCHADQSSTWAAARIAEWFPAGRWNEPHYGQVLAAGRDWAAAAHAELIGLIEDAAAPDIVRATAMALLAQRLAPADIELVARVLDAEGPLLTLAAVEAAAGFPPDRRIDLLQRFLTDEPLALRTAAARALLPVRERLSIRRQADLDAAIEEYLAIQDFNSDRPEGLLNAANTAVDQGRYDAAEAVYLEAIERFPAYPAVYVNLADLYRLLGRSQASGDILRQGLAANPDAAELELALGFALVRQGDAEAALPLFRSAAEHAGDEPYYRYVAAVAENDAGNAELAIELLNAARAEFPGYADMLYALATMLRNAGEIEAAADVARQLVTVMPGDGDALNLLRSLEQPL